MKVKQVPIDDIHPNDYNPNVMADSKFEALIHNIKKDGEMLQPILLNQDLTIIDGEHRWRASKQAGLKKIWSVIIESDEEEARIRTIAFNNIQGNFDPLILNELIGDLADKVDPEELSKSIAVNMNRIDAAMTDINLPNDPEEPDDDLAKMFKGENDDEDYDEGEKAKGIKPLHECPKCGHTFEE